MKLVIQLLKCCLSLSLSLGPKRKIRKKQQAECKKGIWRSHKCQSMSWVRFLRAIDCVNRTLSSYIFDHNLSANGKNFLKNPNTFVFFKLIEIGLYEFEFNWKQMAGKRATFHQLLWLSSGQISIISICSTAPMWTIR